MGSLNCQIGFRAVVGMLEVANVNELSVVLIGNAEPTVPVARTA